MLLTRAFVKFSKHELIESMTNKVAHPMMKFQRKVSLLVESKVLKPSDSIWKLALLYENEWSSD